MAARNQQETVKGCLVTYVTSDGVYESFSEIEFLKAETFSGNVLYPVLPFSDISDTPLCKQ